MSAFYRSRATERGHARSVQRRSPQAGSSINQSAESSTPSPSTTLAIETPAASMTPSSEPTFTLPPDNVKALAGAIVVIGLIILGVVTWKIRAWRRRRKTPASSAFRQEKRLSFLKDSFTDLEWGNSQYPQKAILLPPAPLTPDIDGGWVPQITPWVAPPSPSHPIAGPKPVKHRQSRSARMIEKTKSSLLSVTEPSSPPPKYIVASGAVPSHAQSAAHEPPRSPPRALPVPPPIPSSDDPDRLPPTPPVSLKLKQVPSPQSVPVQVIKSPTRTVSIKKPSASSSGHAPIPKASKTGPVSPLASPAIAKKLPRLVNVARVFTPSEDDELSIAMGETLRLLEEYEDGWCSVQRVGRYDAEKGVIPLFCVEERPELIPSHQKTPSLSRPPLSAMATTFAPPSKITR